MQLQQLHEMAAKKLCPDCGKSMAANHYWYKGGWRCKKAKDEVPATPAPQQAAPAPQQSPKQTITLDSIRKLVPEVDQETYGDMLYWQVYEHKGAINVMWDYTFKRNTHFGAYRQNQNRIMAANAKIKRIADMYPDSVARAVYVTAENAKAYDERAEDDGEGSYSEYEQSISGGITLTP